jgi:tetratricopeptide (TPR) repeat protein
MKVQAWQESVVIPTYEVGKPEKNPIFLEKRVYQGSSGVVYPHPVIEKVSDTPVDKEWQAVWMENDYLKIMLLPELGGRVQMAYDKIRERHFVYYNEVIKPALVGLTGPWISGGIEFNWPQHHRPSTYDPVDFTIEEHADGSTTVWCSEIERMFRTRGMAGFTLYPDKAYMEIRVKLYNRTSQPQTFLWWANPAVAVNDDYQSVFPPDVHAVFDHGKRDVSKFPVATGTYYKMDYSAGVDISRYKNIPVPTSYMAIESKYDFVGGYENDSRGGLLHVANHHVSPGKKQWTWGNGDFGKAWDRNLTDRNGPYIELMCGVYTDNQPDFSWLMPYEEKSFNQYFMPYRDLGVVKNATKDVMLNLEISEGKADVRIYTMGTYKQARVVLRAEEQLLMEETVDLDPRGVFLREVAVNPSLPEQAFHLAVYDEDGKLLIEWSPEEDVLKPVPEPAKAAKQPEEILTSEELYLNGLHLEQYRHATYDPTHYYREALKRDPEDIRNNNAMGMWLLRRGKFAEAEQHFRRAYERTILRNPNPYNGEPLFNLGLALRLQGKDREAYKYLHKSVWNAAFMDSGYFQLAQIDASRKDWAMALENVERSLDRNQNNHKARHLKTALLRKLGNENDANRSAKGADAANKQVTSDLAASNLAASRYADISLYLDRFNFGVLFEKYLLGDSGANETGAKETGAKEPGTGEPVTGEPVTGETGALERMRKLMRGNIHNYMEIALDYAWAGMYEEAVAMLDEGIGQQEQVYPMAYYYKAWIQHMAGDLEAAVESVQQAEKCAPDYCFPHQLESVPALQLAMELYPEGARAPYYLGNFWYNARQYREALECFERSAQLDDTFPTVFRNLALARFNKFGQQEQALADMEKAFALDPSDARILMELNQLYKKVNKDVASRFALLEQYPELVGERDDLYLEKAQLHLLKKEYNIAYEQIMGRKFHPWEGGEGKVSGAYIASLTGMAKQAIEKGRYREAIDSLEKAKVYPENLGEGKLRGAQENQVNYWLGCAYEGMGETGKAREAWMEGSTGLSEPTAAWYYNDQQPDTIYYQGLSLLKLGDEQGARSRFNKLIDYGEKHYFDEIRIDYFAVSLPDLQIWEEDLDRRNRIHCNYLMALGHQGMGNTAKAAEYFRKVLEQDSSHEGALENGQLK